MAQTPASLQLQAGVKTLNPYEVETDKGPYATVAEANAAISSAVRFIGKEAKIITAGVPVLHMYSGGILDSNLVPASGGGSSGLTSFNGRTAAAAMPATGDYDAFYFTQAQSTATYQAKFGNQASNLIYAGPVSGAVALPSFRSLVLNDLPSIASPTLTNSPIVSGDTLQIIANKAQGQISNIASGLSVRLSSFGILDDAVLTMNSVTFGTNQTAAIQAILNTALTKPLYLIWDVKVSVTGLTIYSNTRIEALSGSGAILRNGSNAPLIANANPGTGTIVDKNIKIDGGTWNGNGANQIHDSAPTGWIVGMRFMAVENVELSNLTFNAATTFAVHFANWKKVVCRDINIFTYTPGSGANCDGLHFNGPGRDLYVSNLKGNTNDDLLALSPNDITAQTSPPASSVYGPFAGPGDITDVVVDGVYFTRSYDNTTNSALGIRLLTSTNRLDRVFIKNVVGVTTKAGILIDSYSENPSQMGPVGPGNFGDIRIQNIAFELESGGYKNAHIFVGSVVQSLTIQDASRQSFTNSFPFITVDASAKIGQLRLENYNQHMSSTSFEANIIENKGYIKDLIVQNIRISKPENFGVSNAKVVFNNGGTIDRVLIQDVVADRCGPILDIPTGVVRDISMTNIRHSKTGANATVNNAGFINNIYLDNYSGVKPLSNPSFCLSKRGSAFTDIKPALIESLYGYWGFDGNANSKVAGALNLTSINSPTYANGILGQAASLSNVGLAQHFSVPSKDYMNPANNTGFACGGWVNLTSVNTYQIIASRWDQPGNKREWYIAVSDGGQIAIGYSNTGAAYSGGILYTPFVTANTWMHVLITRNSDNTMMLYVNGVAASAGLSVSPLFYDATTPLTLGSDKTNTTKMNGMLDEWGYWDRGNFTAEEVALLYNGGNPLGYPFSRSVYGQTDISSQRDVIVTSNYTLTTEVEVVYVNSATAVTVTSFLGLGNRGKTVKVVNIGAGIVTIAGTANTSSSIPQNESLNIFSDGKVTYSDKTVRYQTIKGTFTATGTATSTFTVTIPTQANGNYVVTPIAENMLSAASFYVSNKTTTSYDINTLTAVTGVVAFGWTLVA